MLIKIKAISFGDIIQSIGVGLCVNSALHYISYRFHSKFLFRSKYHTSKSQTISNINKAQRSKIIRSRAKVTIRFKIQATT